MSTTRSLILALAAAILTIAGVAASKSIYQQSPQARLTAPGGRNSERYVAVPEASSLEPNAAPEPARIKDDIIPADAGSARTARLEQLARIKDEVLPSDSQFDSVTWSPVAASFSAEQLRAMLDARYLHRVALPR